MSENNLSEKKKIEFQVEMPQQNPLIMIRIAVITAGENIHRMRPTGYKYIVRPGS